MKILYCITSSNWGGAQENVYQLISHRVKKNDSIILVVGNSGTLASKVASNFPQVKIYFLTTMIRKLNLLKDIKSIITFRKIIEKEKPDIIHLHSSKAGAIGRIARNKSVKVIYTVHGWPFSNMDGSPLKNSIFRLIEKILSPLTDYYICVSHYDESLGIKYRILNKSKNNYETIHNAVRIPRLGQQQARKRTAPLRIIMVARFSPQKDQEGLIRVLSKVRKKEYKMTFVGDGPTLQKNKDLSKKLKINDRVQFLGFRDNINSLLSQNDLFILSSHYEGLPYSIIEAMSNGLPIIASNVGGNDEIVFNGINGFLYSSYEELLTIIQMLIKDNDKVKEMGKNSFNIFINDFQIEKQMEKVDRTYNMLINGEL